MCARRCGGLVPRDRVRLGADHTSDDVARLESGPRHPRVVESRPLRDVVSGRPVEHSALVLDPDQRALVAGRGQLPEADGLQRRVGDRVRERLVGDDRALGILVADLPVRGVGAHEGEVGTAIPCTIEGVEHLLRPVLVMAVDEHQPVPEERAGVAMRVDVGLARDVVAHALEETDGLDLPDERALPTLELPRIRAVERDVVRALSMCVVELVQAHPTPAVVRLPGVYRHLHEDHRVVRRWLAQDHIRGPRLPRLPEEAHHQVAARPVGRDRDLVGDGPVRLDEPSCTGRPTPARLPFLERRAANGDAGEQPRAGAAVPAEPVDLDVVRRCGPGADVQVERLAR